MARVVRKVSTKATAGQKKQLDKKTKLWIIICSSVLGARVVAGAIIGIVFAVNNANSTASEDYSYSFSTALTTEGNEVTFEKTTYQGLNNYINENYKDPLKDVNGELYIENVFVFAYDSKSFCPDSSEDDYNKTHAAIVTRLADLQYLLSTIDNAKLFIIDINVGNNINILGDDDNVTMLFSYYKNGEYTEDLSITQEEIDSKKTSVISSKSTDTIYNTCISNAIRQVNVNLK